MRQKNPPCESSKPPGDIDFENTPSSLATAAWKSTFTIPHEKVTFETLLGV
jgi:hypothetical protein